jgi:hypothetical protein
LYILQSTVAAALTFLHLCQMDLLAAGSISFRVLAYYKDHGRCNCPRMLQGSHMTGLNTHRGINLGIEIIQRFTPLGFVVKVSNI